MQITIEGAKWEVDEATGKLAGQVPHDAIHKAVADELSTPERQKASAELTERLFAEVGRRVTDQIQQSIPHIAQAVLDCDISDYVISPSARHMADAITRPRDLAKDEEWNTRVLKNAATVREAQRAEAQATTFNPTPQTDEPTDRWVLRIPQSMTRRLSERALATGMSSADIAKQYIAEGILRFDAQLSPPKVARADIPAEYEYDPSTDSYKRGLVVWLSPTLKNMHMCVPPHGAVLVRNPTDGVASVHTQAVFTGRPTANGEV